MHWYWNPSPWRLAYSRRFNTEEAGDRGTGKIYVEDSYGMAGEGEGERELCRY
jgi:hypothetical protein